MKDKTCSRRKFISKSLYLGSMFFGGALLLGSGAIANDKTTPDQDPKQVKKDPCDDMTGVSPAELAKRKKLAYVNKSPIEDSHCSNCALYLHPAKGKACGGCVLFKGPVRPTGYCAYWAPISE
ncbi:high-potential iron-sulfur protein [Pedobacter heparinus]|uniref:high-potential iron-sulfur protein n=1 Tax=Pedobacter heparinus TaxID=984 RepID=UPI00292E1259|nr:high-potential iron-sulfur protein [Pedobacter heparinus]